MNKFLVNSFFFFAISISYSQDTLRIEDIYFSNDIAYRISNDQTFTGVSRRIRKNGHVVTEGYYHEGIIRDETIYYNSRERDPVEKVIYHKDKVYVPVKKIRYINNKHGAWEIINLYDENGEKILEEHFIEGVPDYRCEFQNGKKHGTELCYDEEGNKLVFQYQSGKKIK